MRKIAKQICGIYYLYQGAQLVYIGKSTNVYYRVGQHAMNCLEFDSWTFRAVDKDRLTIAERAAILKHKPKYNKLKRDNWCELEPLRIARITKQYTQINNNLLT